MKTSPGSQFSRSRGRKSPRSSSRIFLPDGASVFASVPPRSGPATVDATTPSVPTSFTFAAAGDHGANATTALSLAALDASPASFYLALGDLDYDETTSDAAWCDYVHQHLPTKGPDFPFEVVTGNHEDDSKVDGFILNHAACLPDRLGSTAGPGSQYGVEYS